jgi:putative transposase
MLKSMGRKKGQLEFELRYRGRGGFRPGAGRPKKSGAGVPHARRPKLKARHPVHVTARVRDEAARLRSRECFRVVLHAIGAVRERDGFRIVHFTVQRNHVHAIVEAHDEVALARGVQALSIRIARAMNRVLVRNGKVFADRYHAHALKTPREVANAIAYVLGNTHIHAARKGRTIHPDAVDPLSSAANRNFVAEPQTWLLRIGWMWGRPSQQIISMPREAAQTGPPPSPRPCGIALRRGAAPSAGRRGAIPETEMKVPPAAV